MSKTTLKYDPEKIKRLRMEKGWRVTELAFRIGMSQSAVCLIEQGKRQNPATMKKIARVFRVPIRELMTA